MQAWGTTPQPVTKSHCYLVALSAFPDGKTPRMKNIFRILTLGTTLWALLFSAPLSAAWVDQGEISPLWPDNKPPSDVQPAGKERSGKTRNGISNVWFPTLEFFPAAADNNTGAVVLVCPGGGYGGLAYRHEGINTANWLNSVGVNAVVLKYRVPTRKGHKRGVLPLQDAQRALSVIRANADKWKIKPDRVGIIGYSAGGHLSALTSTVLERTYTPADDADKQSFRPNFAMLIYPAYIVSEKDGETWDPAVQITKETPPTFFAHSIAAPYTYKASTRYFEKLLALGVKAEMHIYATGGHGFGVNKNSPGETWSLAAAYWMRANGWLK